MGAAAVTALIAAAVLLPMEIAQQGSTSAPTAATYLGRKHAPTAAQKHTAKQRRSPSPKPGSTPKPTKRRSPKPKATAKQSLEQERMAENQRIRAATLKVNVVGAKTTDTGGNIGSIPIAYVGEEGRSGRYYLPSNYQGQQLPVMVILHGSNMDGLMMVQYFSWLADKYRFIIVAPESRDKLQWTQAEASAPESVDMQHIQACYEYVKGLPNVQFNWQKVLYAGYSRGGYVAASLASRTDYVTHALVLHSSVIPNQLGSHRIPLHFSLGIRDPMFTIARTDKVVANVRAQKPGYDISVAVFKTGHSLSNAAELEDDVKWWLG